jgi:ferredoxin
MNLLAAASKLAPEETPHLAFDAKRCIRLKDRFSQCDSCVRACPSGAIRLESVITLDEKACVDCGLCLRVCPVGAFTGEDGVQDLLNCMARIPQATAIELACPRHPGPEKGTHENAMIVRTNGCLAALGPSAYARWLINRTTDIVVRMDACGECPLGQVQPEIARAIAVMEEAFPNRIKAVVDEPAAGAPARPVFDIKAPPVSRRDFLRLMTGESVRAAARAFASDPEGTLSTGPLPKERRRLLSTLKQLAPDAAARSQPVTGFAAVRLNANEKCTACGVCARACPTHAMRYATTAAEEFRLTCLVSDCTDCGVCIDICEPDALARDGAPTIAEMLATELRVLKTGKLKHCTKCSAPFAAAIEGDLCTVCDFRQRNPFGAWQPRKRSHSQGTPA